MIMMSAKKNVAVVFVEQAKNKNRKETIMGDKLLQVKDLYVNAGEKEILKGMNLSINKGEIHVIMGPNG